LTAWEHDTYGSGSEGMRIPYEVANQRIESHPVRPALRVGSYRALAATANHFARECHLDELAHDLGLDPLELRLRNLVEPRLRAVLLAAAERFGWGSAKGGPDRGFGIAAGAEKNSVVATCVEVAVDPVTSALRLVRVVEAFECGTIVSQDGLRNQVEGCVVQGIGGALFERVEFASGRILNGRFSDYRVPRFSDVPPIDVLLLERKDLAPIGGGETPLVTVAPAIGNAIFDATGVRLRGMPLLPTGIVEGARRAPTAR
jgi:isoquinoline 1-oxidoreductase